ncbi:MAG: hypothetical protein EPN93_13780 [Spirochaetes bacterium]|nr:MAG: hypothetical protein EPN93_13780 [Spirochaetota bacterium]
MHIVLFEDGNHDNFYPLSLTRPIWELRAGCFSLRERWDACIAGNAPGSETWYYTREELVPLARELLPSCRINEPSIIASRESVLFLNCALIPDPWVFSIPENTIVKSNGAVLAANVVPAGLGADTPVLGRRLLNAKGCVEAANPRLKLIDYIWTLVDENPALITRDAAQVRGSGLYRAPVPPGVTITGDPGQIYIAEGVQIDPMTFIDAGSGPVIIGAGTRIHAFTRIEGPCSIGRDCVILGARLRGGTTIGDACRVGGEVEQCIMHARCNKYHDGFLGHSYVGEWVNLGALTTNSDLKNSYSTVKVNLQGRRIQTEKLKVGCFIGDFTRTSIGTLINTGSSIGVGCMLVHAGYMAPRYVPSFAWFMNNQLSEGEPLQTTLNTCGVIMGRRGAVLSRAHSGVLERLYGVCEESRKSEVRKWRDRSK